MAGFVEQVPGKDGVFKIYKDANRNSWKTLQRSGERLIWQGENSFKTVSKTGTIREYDSNTGRRLK
jgi:hypothetical protein